MQAIDKNFWTTVCGLNPQALTSLLAGARINNQLNSLNGIADVIKDISRSHNENSKINLYNALTNEVSINTISSSRQKEMRFAFLSIDRTAVQLSGVRAIASFFYTEANHNYSVEKAPVPDEFQKHVVDIYNALAELDNEISHKLKNTSSVAGKFVKDILALCRDENVIDNLFKVLPKDFNWSQKYGHISKNSSINNSVFDSCEIGLFPFLEQNHFAIRAMIKNGNPKNIEYFLNEFTKNNNGVSYFSRYLPRVIEQDKSHSDYLFFDNFMKIAEGNDKLKMDLFLNTISNYKISRIIEVDKHVRDDIGSMFMDFFEKCDLWNDSENKTKSVISGICVLGSTDAMERLVKNPKFANLIQACYEEFCSSISLVLSKNYLSPDDVIEKLNIFHQIGFDLTYLNSEKENSKRKPLLHEIAKAGEPALKVLCHLVDVLDMDDNIKNSSGKKVHSVMTEDVKERWLAMRNARKAHSIAQSVSEVLQGMILR